MTTRSRHTVLPLLARSRADVDSSSLARPRACFDDLPDVRDGLTRLERVVLVELSRAQEEFGERYVPSALLYGRVVEHMNVSVDEFQRVLVRLGRKQSRDSR